MEFLVVSKTKLKIILNKEERERYSLSDFTSSDSPELRERLCEILREAYERVGFDTHNGRILVSYYPTRLAGAELFVTAIPETGETRYYIFSELSELSRTCRAILSDISDSRVYLLPSGDYCLALSMREDSLEVASEFSRPENSGRIRSLVSHARLLAEGDAAHIFASL